MRSIGEIRWLLQVVAQVEWICEVRGKKCPRFFIWRVRNARRDLHNKQMDRSTFFLKAVEGCLVAGDHVFHLDLFFYLQLLGAEVSDNLFCQRRQSKGWSVLLM